MKCAEQTIVSHHTIVGKSIILQLEEKKRKIGNIQMSSAIVLTWNISNSNSQLTL